MSFLENTITFRATSGSSTGCDAASSTRIIECERQWRALPPSATIATRELSIEATRWCSLTDQTLEVHAKTADDFHVAKIVLRNTNVRLWVAGSRVQDGIVTPGMFHVTGPAAPVRGLFRGPYDVLHLHIPNSLIGECTHDVSGRPQSALPTRTAPKTDPMVERLGRALLDADEIGGMCGRLYADCIGVAIVARLLASGQPGAACERAKAGQLAPWRLKRALDYVEAHLAGPIRLADIASASGLTRMYFAAQFRASTGLRPHEYLMRRRIERAQEILLGSEKSLVDVAHAVGFQSQPHFTTAFKRLVGQPPSRWCKSQERRYGRPLASSGGIVVQKPKHDY